MERSRISKIVLHKFMNLKLTYKTIFIYVLAVLIPTGILAGYFYQANLKALEETYYENQRNNILSSKENLTVQLNQIMATHQYYQQSDVLIELLKGGYPKIADTLFYYLRDIMPLTRAAKVNPMIQKISIYGYQEYALNMENGLSSIRYLDREESFIKEVREQNGLWELQWANQAAALRYYRNINVNVYPYDIGILMLTVNVGALSERINKQLSRPFFYALPDGAYLGFEDGRFVSYASLPEVLANPQNQVYTLSISENFPQLLIPILPMQTLRKQSGFLLFTLFIMVIVFTVFYILQNSSITCRLKALAAHIKAADVEELTPYQGNSYLDEVGFAINAYNELVMRTNTLIHENLKVQIQKRESDYYALQAQIQPHFLYNVLENIRMNAEAHHDSVTADMLEALGKHMRYNLNMSSRPILFEKELYSAKNYLQIHKIRMKEKMQFEILISTEIEGIYCPRFLLQPLLENALQHGYPLDRPLEISIEVTAPENLPYADCIEVRITDNGNGISEELLLILTEKINRKQVEESSHVGLLNVNGRLSSFNQLPGASLFLSSKVGQGATVTFYLRRVNPYHENTDSGR